MKRKIILISLLTLLLMSSQASASVMVHGKDINTIGDILNEARGGELVKKGNDQQSFELPKASILRIYDEGQKVELTYGIGSSNKTESLGFQIVWRSADIAFFKIMKNNHNV